MNYFQVFLALQHHKRVTGQELIQRIDSIFKTHFADKFPHSPNISEPTLSRLRRGKMPDIRQTAVFNAIIEKIMREDGDIKKNEKAELFLEALATTAEIEKTLAGWNSRTNQPTEVESDVARSLVGVWQTLNITTHGTSLKNDLFEGKVRSRILQIYRSGTGYKCQGLGSRVLWPGQIEFMGNYIHISKKEMGTASTAESLYAVFKHPGLFAEKETESGKFVLLGYVITIVSGIWNEPEKPEHLFSGKALIRKLPGLSKKYGGNTSLFRSEEKHLRDYCRNFTVREVDGRIEVDGTKSTTEDGVHITDLVSMLKGVKRDGPLVGGDYSVIM